jgi:predicted MPP superfamily phosphohydrolase
LGIERFTTKPNHQIQSETKMKILSVADLHMNHEWFDWVSSHCDEYDLLVVAGDLHNAFSNISLHEQARAASKWLLSLKTPVVSCTGNHDYWAENRNISVDVYAEGGWLRTLRRRGNIIAVDGDVVEFSGLRLAVNGWLKVPDLHERVDILVTHAPPSGCACASGLNGLDVGDPDLWSGVQDCPPTLVLCGHVHLPSKNACSWPPIDPTSLILVPGCDEQNSVPAHWAIDTQTHTAIHSSGAKVRYEIG